MHARESIRSRWSSAGGRDAVPSAFDPSGWEETRSRSGRPRGGSLDGGLELAYGDWAEDHHSRGPDLGVLVADGGIEPNAEYRPVSPPGRVEVALSRGGPVPERGVPVRRRGMGTDAVNEEPEDEDSGRQTGGRGPRSRFRMRPL